MIELAPNHKLGLRLNRPLMPASGFFGYGGNPYPGLIDLQTLGAIVTNPITLRPYPFAEPPTFAETSGGVVVAGPPANPGVRRIIQQHRRQWQKSPLPIIAHLPAEAPPDLSRTARALSGLGCVAAFELGLPPDSRPDEVRAWVKTILQQTELPLLVKLPSLPLNELLTLIEEALRGGASSITLTGPPVGSLLSPNKPLILGDYYGAGRVTQLLALLVDVQSAWPEVPVIASGGLHTPADWQSCCTMGAVAGQLDSLLWRNPRRAGEMMAAA